MKVPALRPLLLLALAACAPREAAPPADASAAAIARVTAGLRPGIVIKGAPSVTYSLAERMARHKVPGISIAVAEGGTLAWAKGFGVKEAGTADSVTPTTLFQAASISKPVAATVLLRLVDEGKLDLDQPVNGYLTSWKLPDNKFTAGTPVTLRHLVSHQAGTTVHGFPGYAEGEAVPTVPQILDGAKPANTAAVRVDTTPGARWRYSGGGITIEQLAMTDVTGEDFPSLARRLVLEPIGMSNSTYEQPLPAPRRAQAAAGYRPDGAMVKGRWHTYPEMAAAGLWTTPSDLLKWAMEVTAARAGTSTRILTQKTATAMLTMQKEPSGLGPLLHGTGKGFYFEHGGANEGYRCSVMYFPETGKGAAVMTNSDAGDALAREVLYAIAAEYQWLDYGPREVEPIALDSVTLQQLVGEYPVPQAVVGGTTPVSQVMTVEGGKLYAEVAGFVPRVEMVLVKGDRLLAPETGFEVELSRDKAGAIDGINIGPAVLRRKK